MALTRRRFLIGTGLVGGGLILGFALQPDKPVPNTRPGSFQPNAWLQITEEGEFIFQLDKAEMGQGVITGMPMVLAEELDVDPRRIKVEFAGIHPDFANPAMGVQLTGGSTSTPTSWLPLREAGATARAMLLAAAARIWGVSSSSCHSDDGEVVHASGKRLAYAELVSEAREAGSPGKVSLKDIKDFRWIGTSVPRHDIPGKTDGSAQFGVDINLPGMKTAVVRRCPHFGGTLQSFSDDKARSMSGVRAIFVIHSGVAVVADSYWQARKAADALDIDWHKGPLAGLSSADIAAGQKEALNQKKPRNQMDKGNFERAFENAATTLDVRYNAPYTHHSPMEPQNTTAWVRGDQCEVWCPSQGPDLARAVIAHFTGFKRDNITVHSMLSGGGFGRRGYVDFAGEAAAIAKGYNEEVPVKLIWSREDDMRHDYYRPATHHAMQAGLDEDGNLIAWQHRLVSTSIIQGFGVDLFATLLPGWVPTQFARSVGQGLANFAADYDPTMAEGALIPYAVDNIRIGSVWYDPGIRTGFWRSVGHSHNAFVAESFMDECAHAAGQDPAEFRRAYLKNHPRHLQVLDAVLKLADYGKSGAYQGIAVHESFDGFVAQVAQVSVNGDSFRVDRVYCVADCGLVINPDIVAAQLEGGIIYALSAALKAPVTFEDGATVQSNFHDLPVLRMDESPEIITATIASNEPPGGVGEISVPPLAAAVANALFQATGQRLRDMPLRLNSNAGS